MEDYNFKYRLAIVVSHPIQYYSPLFRELAKEINLKVFYCFNPSSDQQGKDGFGISFKWDVDLLSGYEYEFLENFSKRPSSSIRSGCDTPEVGVNLDLFNPTHIVTFGWHLKSYQQVLSYCRRKSIPIAVRGDSKIDNTDGSIRGIIKRLYYPIFLKQYDAFLSVGTENKRYLMKYGVSSSNIIFSPHAVDQQFWKGVKQAHNKFSFIWVAKFIPLKRPFDVIDAFLQLHEENPDIELKMIGSGPLLEASIKRAAACKEIIFLGFKNQIDLRNEYLKSDVLILSSDSETWGLVVNEAFAVGLKAIVSSEVGCSVDLIKPNTGLMYSVGNVTELLESMKKIYLKRNNQSCTTKLAELNSIFSFKRNVMSFEEFIASY